MGPFSGPVQTNPIHGWIRSMSNSVTDDSVERYSQRAVTERPRHPRVVRGLGWPVVWVGLGWVWNCGSAKNESRVELAGLPTPLTFHPLPSIPFHFALLPAPTNYTAGYFPFHLS